LVAYLNATAADSVFLFNVNILHLRVWEIIKYNKSIQKIHNPDLDIEGLLLTMYDSRLRLSNQVEEVQNILTIWF
jgi:chromosome partitioning protein